MPAYFLNIQGTDHGFPSDCWPRTARHGAPGELLLDPCSGGRLRVGNRMRDIPDRGRRSATPVGPADLLRPVLPADVLLPRGGPPLDGGLPERRKTGGHPRVAVPHRPEGIRRGPRQARRHFARRPLWFARRASGSRSSVAAGRCQQRRVLADGPCAPERLPPIARSGDFLLSVEHGFAPRGRRELPPPFDSRPRVPNDRCGDGLPVQRASTDSIVLPPLPFLLLLSGVRRNTHPMPRTIGGRPARSSP